MPITQFPDPSEMGDETYIAVGGDLHPQSLMLAYRRGIFPWPDSSLAPMLWACPPERGIVPFASLHRGKSLRRAGRRLALEFSCDQAFAEVIAACAAMPRPGQRGTWITGALRKAYLDLHRAGHAHSFEAWSEGKIVAGLYGVDVDGVFCGESMFYLEPNASKLLVLHVCDFLADAGADWMDIQVLTPHMEALGAQLIPRAEFLARLEQTRLRDLRPFAR